MKKFVIQDQETIDEQIVKEKILDSDEVRIQFSKPVYTAKTLAQIDRLTFENNSKLKIRFYNDGFDCKALEEIPNVKALSIDCVRDVKNIGILKQLKFLNKIGIGIFNLDDMDILSYDNLKQVEKLSILDTKSNALNLEHLKGYGNLTDLQIASHTKNIDALSGLSQLKTLSLNAIRKVPLRFVNHLESLKELSILLGGRDNINEIGENRIEYLELIWIRGFNDLSGINDFKYLKSLKVENQIQLKEIHFPRLDFLEDVKLLSCKSLSLISGLDQLRSLTDLRISQSAIDFENFITLKFPEKLKTVAFYTWKSKQDKLNRVKLDKMGFFEFS